MVSFLSPLVGTILLNVETTPPYLRPHYTHTNDDDLDQIHSQSVNVYYGHKLDENHDGHSALITQKRIDRNILIFY